MGKFTLTGFADEIDASLETQLDVMGKLNIKYIEMRGVNGKGLVNHTLKQVEEIKKQLDSRNFKLSAVGSPIGKIKITDPFEPHLDLFKHTLKVAQITEAPYIRMFSFFIPEGEDALKYRDEVLKRWDKFLSAALNYDVVLLHENEKEIYGDTAKRCLDLIQTFDTPKLKAIFDPANFIQCDVKTYPHAYELLKDHIEYFHIKDALFENKKVVPAGEGDGKIYDILKDIYKSGFEGFLSLEPHLGSFEGFSELELENIPEDLEEGGPLKFSIAVQALRKIINDIE